MAIGVPMYLSGCDKSLQSKCGRYHFVNATTVNYTITTRVCSECTGRKCRTRTSWACYDSAAVQLFVLDGRTRTCDLTVRKGAGDLSAAMTSASAQFPMGVSHIVLVDKLSLECVSDDIARWMAIIGIALFVLGGVSTLVWAALEVVVYMQRQQELQRQRPSLAPKGQEVVQEAMPPVVVSV